MRKDKPQKPLGLWGHMNGFNCIVISYSAFRSNLKRQCQFIFSWWVKLPNEFKFHSQKTTKEKGSISVSILTEDDHMFINVFCVTFNSSHSFVSATWRAMLTFENDCWRERKIYCTIKVTDTHTHKEIERLCSDPLFNKDWKAFEGHSVIRSFVHSLNHSIISS